MSIVVPVVVIFHLLGFLYSINAIMETRTPQGSAAWTVFLLTFPYVAVPLYWVLGRRRFRGYVSAKSDSESDLAGMAADVRQQLLQYHFKDTGETVLPENRVTETLTGSPYVTGNAVELLIDGEATFFSILEGIARASEYILFQFFIIKDDDIGRQVKAALEKKAREGVKVYLLFDEIGSHGLSETWLGELGDAGVSVRAFQTRKGPHNRFQLNFRNHRKVVVVDGSEIWIGGHNVGDEYLGRDPRFGRWRDTHVYISGPAVLEGQFTFIEDWYWATGEIPELYWNAVPSPESDIPVLVAPSGPADKLETASLLFTHAINTAEKRIWKCAR